MELLTERSQLLHMGVAKRFSSDLRTFVTENGDKNDFGRIPESRPKLNISDARQAAKNRARESLIQELEEFPESRDRF